MGVRIKVGVTPPSFLREWRSQVKVEFFRGSWLADYPDAENYFAVFYSKNGSPPNYTRFNNKHFDELYEKALAPVSLMDETRISWVPPMLLSVMFLLLFPFKATNPKAESSVAIRPLCRRAPPFGVVELNR